MPGTLILLRMRAGVNGLGAGRGSRCGRPARAVGGPVYCERTGEPGIEQGESMTTLENRPNTALLVIDVQQGAVDGGHQRDEVVDFGTS